jgi:hypothetical protein
MRALRPAAAAIGLLWLGCGGSPSPAVQTARDTASIQTRLVSGPWRLADYRPDVSLEPMLQALLLQQLQTMVVRFDGQKLSALSPTLQISRPYTITNVAGLVFDIVSPDFQGGGTLRSHCEMSDDGQRVVFRAQTEPWTGTGVINRL